LRTPSVDMNCWENDEELVSERALTKLCMLICSGSVYGEPPLSRTKTFAPCESVAASGQPHVPPPMTI